MKKYTYILLFFIISFGCNATNVLSKTILKSIEVSSTQQLQQALSNAKEGDVIVMRDGTYIGNFVIPTTANGTAEKPIILKGSSKVILNGNTTKTGYVLHLQANYWIIQGFTITNGLKGIMTDKANYNVIDNITVYDIGEEAIHLRRNSSFNTVQNCKVYNTGLKTADYGEGIYIGTAVSNWEKYTDGLEDKSDSNKILNNTIGPNISAECIDIKEGTTGGLISGNKFNSTGITGANSADSWIDVKGNNFLIENNEGFNPKGSVLKDGYQVNCAVDGWGCNNIFKNNICEVNADGYAIRVNLKSKKGEVKGTKVYDTNKAIEAAKGITNIELIKE